MHTFSPAKMWIGGLKILQKPLLHLHTQFNRDILERDRLGFHEPEPKRHGDRELALW
jgi:L-arabinose isomerase